MLAGLHLLAGLIVVAVGANLFTEAPQHASAERNLLRGPRWYDRNRETSLRLVGVLLVAFGLAICIDAFV